MRWLMLMPTLGLMGGSCVGLSLSAVEYHFTIGVVQQYLVETKQEVAWDSAGDHLAFTSSVATLQAWKCIAIDGSTATVEATILRVIAKHQGPGSDHRFDSSLRMSTDPSVSDPLLGHLKALDGVTLTLRIDQLTGATRVSGGAVIADAIAKRAPNLMDPTAPSPMAAQAQQLYGDANLSRIWSQTLALPAFTPQPVALGEPLTGTLNRIWKGQTYTLQGEVGGTAVLAKEPTAVTAAVSAVTGDGELKVTASGWPGTAGGHLRFALTINALTQPVTQQHIVTWQIAQIPNQAAPPSGQ